MVSIFPNDANESMSCNLGPVDTVVTVAAKTESGCSAEKNVDVIQLAIVQSAATSQIEDAAAFWPEKSFSSSGPTHSQN